MKRKERLLSLGLDNRLWRETILILSVGFALGVLLIMTANQDGSRLVKIIILLTVSIIVFAVAPDREKLLVFLMVYFLSFQLDFELWFEDHPVYIRPVNGFRVTMIDLFFIYPFLNWIYRMTKDLQVKIDFAPLISIPFWLIFLLSAMGLMDSYLPPTITIATLWLVFKNSLFLAYFINNINDKRTLMTVLTALILTGVTQAIIGILQYLTGGTLGLELFGEVDIFEMQAGSSTVSRIGGTLGHANQFAMFMGMLIQLNFVLLFARTSLLYKKFLILSFILMVSAMILSFSRGGFVGMFLAGAITGWWCLSKRTKFRVISAILVFAMLAVAALSAITLVKPLRQRFFEDDRGSADTRPEMRIVARNIIRDNPLLGVGLNCYTSVIFRYDTTKSAISYDFPNPVHDEYLLIGAEQGLPALFLFLFILSMVFLTLITVGRRTDDPLIPYVAIGFLGAFVTLCFQINFDYIGVFFVNNIWFYIGIIFALKRLTSPNTASNTQ